MGDLSQRVFALETSMEFLEEFEELQDIAHNTAVEKGWWNPPKTFGEQLLLMHTEISEAVEEYRAGRSPNEIYYNESKPEGIPIEFADLFIRLLDACGYNNIDLIGATIIKMRYNLSRSQRHGGKVI